MGKLVINNIGYFDFLNPNMDEKQELKNSGFDKKENTRWSTYSPSVAYNFIETMKTNFANNRIIKADISKEFELNKFLASFEERELDNPINLSIKIVSFFNPEISEFISIMEAQNKKYD